MVAAATVKQIGSVPKFPRFSSSLRQKSAVKCSQHAANTIAGRRARDFNHPGDPQSPGAMETYIAARARQLWRAWGPRLFCSFGLPDYQTFAAGVRPLLHHFSAAFLCAQGLPDLPGRARVFRDCRHFLLASDALVSPCCGAVLCRQHGGYAAVDVRASVVIEYRGAVLSTMAVCAEKVVPAQGWDFALRAAG